jgi:DNA-binding response OmpR family regulator
MKRILIVAADSLVTEYYGHGLKALGFEIRVANTLDSAIVASWELQPDLVLIEPIFPEPVADPAGRIRAGGRLTVTPFVALSYLPESMAIPLRRSGVKVAIERTGNSVEQVLAAINHDLGGIDLEAAMGQMYKSRWCTLVTHSAAQTIATLRLAAHSLVKSGFAASTLHTLLFEAHCLSLGTELASLGALHQMTAALEGLVAHMHEQPANINPSTVRTLTQAIDFLEMLFLPNNIDRISDPAYSQVFVVDDDQNLLNMLQEGLHSVGLNTVCISDPLIALEMARSGVYNLVLLDVGMPELNGFDLCTKLREIPAYKNTPILFLTGMATFPNQVQAKLRGSNDFIAKPFQLSELSVKALIWIFKEQLGLT